MIKVVLFDLDGTLLDRDASVRLFIERQYERLNQWLGHIQKDEFIHRFIYLDCNGYVWKDKVYQQLVQEFNIEHITWEFLLEDYMNEFKHHCVPFPNLTKMLASLKKKQLLLGIITNGFEQFQMNHIRALGIEHFFDTILVSEREGIKKPNPAIFERALSNLQVSPCESIYVGDHPENDIEGARQVGMISMWKKNDAWKEIEADFVIEDLNEIPFIIDEIQKSNK